MATADKRQRLRDIDNTGFGANSSVEGGRLLNPDGSANLRKVGIPLWERISIYHTLLRMKPVHFILCVFLFYTAINIVFACTYFFIGVDSLGVAPGATLFVQFTEAFFFSSQTLTTVGYGHMAPHNMAANIVASTESLVGILSFAVVTGLIYGRFSRPRAYLLFSPSLLVAPYKDGKAVMLRMATYKNNHLTDVEAGLTLALHEHDGTKNVTRFYPLKLEITKINSMALSWTLVHHITEDSPLSGYTKEDVDAAKMEVIVIIKAFDDHFSNVVQQRTSYTYKQVIYGAKFLPMFERSPDGGYTLLELDRINAHEFVKLPESIHDVTSQRG